jgi:hypothetical protein
MLADGGTVTGDEMMAMLVISRTLASAAKLYGGCPSATHRHLLCFLRALRRRKKISALISWGIHSLFDINSPVAYPLQNPELIT